MTGDLAEVREFLDRRGDFLCVAHSDADADSLGSALAFADHLQRQGKRAYVWAPRPVPASLAYLPGYESVNRREAPPEAVAVGFDASSLGRFGELQERIAAAPARVVLDHHASGGDLGNLGVVDKEAAATGAIVYRVLDGWGPKISPEAATNLYAAVFTDTGGFRHGNTSVEVLRLGARLGELGAEVAFVGLKSYKSRSRGTLTLQALAGAAAHYEMDGKLIWSEVTQEMLRQAGATMEESEGIIDVLQSLDSMECAVLFKEEGPERTKVSVRTAEPMAAHRLVAEFGGGGHSRAAGAEVAAPLERVRELVLAKARVEVSRGAGEMGRDSGDD